MKHGIDEHLVRMADCTHSDAYNFLKWKNVHRITTLKMVIIGNMFRSNEILKLLPMI